MYEELIKRLREYSTARKGEIAELTEDAADAIEELSKAIDRVNDAHNEGYDVGYWAGRRARWRR